MRLPAFSSSVDEEASDNELHNPLEVQLTFWHAVVRDCSTLQKLNEHPVLLVNYSPACAPVTEAALSNARCPRKSQDVHSQDAQATKSPAFCTLVTLFTANQIAGRIRTILATSFSLVDVDDHAPLMESGLDSFDVPRLVNELNAAFKKQLPATLVLECSTIQAIVTKLVGKADCSRAPLRLHQPTADVALLAAAGSWPGGTTAAQLFPLMHAAADAILEVPAQRWTTQPQVPPHGGFIPGAERFDNSMFGISAAEVGLMDPQQRLVLEVGYEALHGAMLRRNLLFGRDLGVFVGMMNSDFAILHRSESVYAATGSQLSIASGRLAFALGTQGPAVTVDTACSSALVALDGAMLSLGHDACDSAIVPAVNLVLTPSVSLLFSAAGMLSAVGRCQTFDARASGYVRSEGVGAAALQGVSTCEAAASIVAGCAVRADGKGVSLTAPNGTAQTCMICAVHAAASADALGLIETHGTGTALGDPTEVGALERALGSAEEPCLSAVKANVGHAEPVAGMLGLLAVMQSAEQIVSGANAQLRMLNPLLELPLLTLRARVPIQGSQLIGRAAVGASSFGYVRLEDLNPCGAQGTALTCLTHVYPPARRVVPLRM